jgi:hypothetical protein
MCSQSLDPAVLARLCPAGSGGNGGRRPPCLVSMPDDDDEREARNVRLDCIRKELLSLLGGDEPTFEVLLKVATGELSYRQLGALLGVNSSTAFRAVQRCFQRLRRMRAARLAKACFDKGEGFTIDTQRGALVPVGSVEGFAVSLGDEGRVYREPPRLEDILTYLSRTRRFFQADLTPKHYFGGWVCDGYHLDVTVILPVRSQAMAFAKTHGQRCIFDVKRGVDLFVDDGEGRQAA